MFLPQPNLGKKIGTAKKIGTPKDVLKFYGPTLYLAKLLRAK